jgi:hypothetical protein
MDDTRVQIPTKRKKYIGHPRKRWEAEAELKISYAVR